MSVCIQIPFCVILYNIHARAVAGACIVLRHVFVVMMYLVSIHS